jgi:hypothetical protein
VSVDFSEEHVASILRIEKELNCKALEADSQGFACCLFLSVSFFGLLSNPEDVGCMFLRTVRRQRPSQLPLCELGILQTKMCQ